MNCLDAMEFITKNADEKLVYVGHHKVMKSLDQAYTAALTKRTRTSNIVYYSDQNPPSKYESNVGLALNLVIYMAF